MKRIFASLALLACASLASCADPDAPKPIRDGNSGIVINKDLNVQPWGNYYYLLVNGPGPENVHWVSVSESDWLDCQVLPNTPNDWQRNQGCS